MPLLHGLLDALAWVAVLAWPWAVLAAAIAWAAVTARLGQDTSKTYATEQRVTVLETNAPATAGYVIFVIPPGGPPAAAAGQGVLYPGSAAAQPRWIDQGGIDASLDRTIGVYSTNYTSTTTTNTQISNGASFPANTLPANTEIEITAEGRGVWESNTWTITVYVQGTLWGSVTIGGALITGGHAFAYSIRATITILAAGSGGTCHVHVDGLINDVTANRLVSTSGSGNIPFLQDDDSKPVDTTSAATFFLMAAWGANATGQTATTYKTRISRRGS